METKDQLVNSIRDWIQIDNEMRSLQERLKVLRNQKKENTGNLVNVMKSNEIDCFDINDGKLIYAKTKVKKAINKDYLLKTLTTYFEDNSEKAAQLSKFLLDQREENIKESIRRKMT